MSRVFLTRVAQRYICLRCQSRPNLQVDKQTLKNPPFVPFRSLHDAVRPQKKRKLVLRPSRSYSQLASSQTYRYAHLTNRSLIKLEGPGVPDFLQGLIPANILDRTRDADSKSIYTAFLTAQGRILQDVFIYPPPREDYQTSAWYVDVDADSATSLMQHLKKHKLRSKFKLERVSQDAVRLYQVWPGPGSREDQRIPGFGHAPGLRSDLRPAMSTRGLISSNNPYRVMTMSGYEDLSEGSLQDYTIHRVVNGIAEGSSEIISGSALPQESNLDFFDGIDFHKGCYLGQELTIRTHHTGIVRKRILPCQIYNDQNPISEGQELPVYSAEANLQPPPRGSNISKANAESKGRSRGKWLGGVGNIGLALCRLEMMTDVQMTAESTNFNSNDEFRVTWSDEGGSSGVSEVKIKAFLPSWLRAGLEDGIRRRERKKEKPREEDEELEEDVLGDGDVGGEKLLPS